MDYNENKPLFKYPVKANNETVCYIYTENKEDFKALQQGIANTLFTYIIKYFAIGFVCGVILTLLATPAKATGLSKKQLSTVKSISSSIKNPSNKEALLAIAFIESSFNPRAVGGVGEVGLFQLHPRYFKISRKATISEQVVAAERHLIWLKHKCNIKATSRLIVAWNRGCKKAKSLSIEAARHTRYYKKYNLAKEFISGEIKKHENSRAFSPIEFKIAQSQNSY